MPLPLLAAETESLPKPGTVLGGRNFPVTVEDIDAPDESPGSQVVVNWSVSFGGKAEGAGVVPESDLEALVAVSSVPGMDPAPASVPGG